MVSWFIKSKRIIFDSYDLILMLTAPWEMNVTWINEVLTSQVRRNDWLVYAFRHATSYQCTRFLNFLCLILSYVLSKILIIKSCSIVILFDSILEVILIVSAYGRINLFCWRRSLLSPGKSVPVSSVGKFSHQNVSFRLLLCNRVSLLCSVV